MVSSDVGLVYVGKIIETQSISNADFIVSATVVCGSGGKWRGIVRKSDFNVNDLCVVYLPDSLVPETQQDMQFLKSSGWRVKMQRFRGAPSEVVIMPLRFDIPVGTDLTKSCGVTRYHKPVAAHLNGVAVGPFPSFIPKTDEPNYQSNESMVDSLVGKPYYITVKMDGSSTTAYKHNGVFGLCSRNLQLERNEQNGYWQIAIRYHLEDLLPDGYALQFETCGPGVQSNPMGLTSLDGFAFSAYKINECRYLEYTELLGLLKILDFPMCPVVSIGESFDKKNLENLGCGTYSNGKPREGVVVRSQYNIDHGKPISFKIINLDYEK